MNYVDRVLENLIAKNPGENEFHQAVTESLKSIESFVCSNKIYEEMSILER